MTGPVILKVSVEYPGDSYTVDYEISRQEWDSMTPSERTKWAEDTAQTEFFNACNYGYTVDE